MAMSIITDPLDSVYTTQNGGEKISDWITVNRHG